MNGKGWKDAKAPLLAKGQREMGAPGANVGHRPEGQLLSVPRDPLLSLVESAQNAENRSPI